MADRAPMMEATTRTDIVFDEECRWFASPRMPEATRQECRTSDGVVLRNFHRIEGVFEREMVATRLERREVSVSEILPPDELFRPGTWGLPE